MFKKVHCGSSANGLWGALNQMNNQPWPWMFHNKQCGGGGAETQSHVLRWIVRSSWLDKMLKTTGREGALSSRSMTSLLWDEHLVENLLWRPDEDPHHHHMTRQHDLHPGRLDTGQNEETNDKTRACCELTAVRTIHQRVSRPTNETLKTFRCYTMDVAHEVSKFHTSPEKWLRTDACRRRQVHSIRWTVKTGRSGKEEIRCSFYREFCYL